MRSRKDKSTAKPETKSSSEPIKYYEDLTPKQKELIEILFNTNCAMLNPYEDNNKTLANKRQFITSFFMARIYSSQLVIM